MTAPCPTGVAVSALLLTGWEIAQGDEARFVPAAMPVRVSDASECSFRCLFEWGAVLQPASVGVDEEIILEFGGIATLSEVRLNGHSILKSNSMFARHRVD